VRVFLNPRYILIFVLFAALPFFEGLRTPSGLFLAHSLVLISTLFILFYYNRIWMPPYLGAFIPFLLVLVLSVWIAPYTYSAFLDLWDYWMAAIFAIFMFSFLKENQENVEKVAFIAFLLCTISIVITALIAPNFYNVRWKGTFVNPNDFGTFCLLLFVFGLFCFERASSTVKKVVTSFCLVFLVVCIAMASSRSVLLATSVTLIYYLWKKRASRLISAFLVIALIASAAVIYIRLFHIQDPFQYYRFKIWKYSLQGIMQDPYLGIGLNMLPYRASQFNFPADQEVGRYSRVATSADNQYLQILIETGFLGFFLFLIGWIGIYFGLRKLPQRFLVFQCAYFIISIISFFASPLENTAILFLFLFLILFPFVFDPEQKYKRWNPGTISKVLAASILAAIFIFAVFCPYKADREFNSYVRTSDPEEANEHLRTALRLNPFQPYYGYTAVRRIVDSHPTLPTEQWEVLAKRMDYFIKLNPLETDFYAYKARIFRSLLDQTSSPTYYNNAVASYRLAIQKSPYNVFLRAEYAFFEAALGHLEQAESELHEILKIEPAYLNARLLLAEVMQKRGDIESARNQFMEEDRLQKKHANLKYYVDEPYVRKLIQVDESHKNKIKNLIFDAATPSNP
jgi:O-antigen ligase